MSDNISSLPYLNCNLVKHYPASPPPPPPPSFPPILMNYVCGSFVSGIYHQILLFLSGFAIDAIANSFVFQRYASQLAKKFLRLFLNQSEVKQQLSSRTTSSCCFSCLAPIPEIDFQIPLVHFMTLSVVILVLRRKLILWTICILPYF